MKECSFLKFGVTTTLELTVQTLHRERQYFKVSRSNQMISPKEIEKLFFIHFQYTDDILVILKVDIEDMKHYKLLINKLIEQLEL